MVPTAPSGGTVTADHVPLSAGVAAALAGVRALGAAGGRLGGEVRDDTVEGSTPGAGIPLLRTRRSSSGSKNKG